MRIIAAFQKNKDLSLISHLDIQRTLQRAFRRAGLPVAFSNGFNPHPRLSFATALATGFQSNAEWIDVEFAQDIRPEDFITKTNAVLQQGIHFHTAFVAEPSMDSLSKLLQYARYSINIDWTAVISKDLVMAAVSDILSESEIMAMKKTKSGVRKVNIRPEIIDAAVTDGTDKSVHITLIGTLNASGGLRVESFLTVLYESLGAKGYASVKRTDLYFDGSNKLLPSLTGSN